MNHAVVAVCLATAFGLASAPVHAQSVNLARLGTASQSTDFDQISTADRAIDGVTNGAWTFTASNSLSSTANSSPSWWRLDFPSPVEVERIRVWNRQNCCAERLSNFTIHVGDAATGVLHAESFFVGTGHVPDGGTVETVTPAGTLATYVLIDFIGGLNNVNNAFLTLAEVEVFGPALGTVECTPATPNSAGRVAEIRATGSLSLASATPTSLIVHGLPPQSFGLFVVGDNAASVIPPGAVGPLCVGGALGRYNAFVASTGWGATLAIEIDRAALPINPPQAILPGQTWRFQLWYRDGALANFSDAVALTFS